jgi:hypothetical protein
MENLEKLSEKQTGRLSSKPLGTTLLGRKQIDEFKD